MSGISVLFLILDKLEELRYTTSDNEGYFLLRYEYLQNIPGKKAIAETLAKISNGENLSCQLDEKEIAPLVITKSIQLSQPSKTGNILILNTSDSKAPTPNPYLVNAIVKSHYYQKILLEGKVKNIIELQNLEGLKDTKYIRNILSLKFLPPKLMEQILNGTQYKDLSLQKLFSISFSWLKLLCP